MAHDLEFFFDPVCPWAWLTSRWVEEVRAQRSYDVRWRFISLWIVNEDLRAEWYTPEYRAGHLTGHQALRVADEIRLRRGDAAVGEWYTAIGTAFHLDGQRSTMTDDPESFVATVLDGAGFDADLAGHVHDESHDEYIRADTALALERTGKDVGTPILTFHPGTEAEASLFGPVIPKVPRGERAVQLWDAIETVAASGVAELKRTLRGRIDFT
jgi:2-hydroxychromene-2-carboxylate isomerase